MSIRVFRVSCPYETLQPTNDSRVSEALTQDIGCIRNTVGTRPERQYKHLSEAGFHYNAAQTLQSLLRNRHGMGVPKYYGMVYFNRF
jgi:hypothetical protein